MKVRADISKCEAYANCIIAAPDFFTLNDNNVVQVAENSQSEERRDEIEEAVLSCPTQALTLEG